MLWVEVVNRTLEWEDAVGIERLRRVWRLEGVEPAAVRAAAAVVRGAAAARLLDSGSELGPAASQWLDSVTLRAARPERRDGFELPALRAARRGSDLPRDLEELLSTALVQLAATAGAVATRCAGVTRRPAPGAADAAAERAFARRADLDGLLVDGLRQCARVVAGPRHGQYCGKACSNAAFALRKAAREPGYFARKQARYRLAKDRPAARVESAFAFVD